MPNIKFITTTITSMTFATVAIAPSALAINANMLTTTSEVKHGLVAQWQEPAARVWILGNQVMQKCVQSNCYEKIPNVVNGLDSARHRLGDGFNQMTRNSPNPFPQPAFSQNRYGYTQTCNQYGCVSVPNH
jgi:hypothetical protein